MMAQVRDLVPVILWKHRLMAHQYASTWLVHTPVTGTVSHPKDRHVLPDVSCHFGVNLTVYHYFKPGDYSRDVRLTSV